MTDKPNDAVAGKAATGKKPYCPPRLTRAGTLAELTQGFSGSLPDEQGGMTKQNPFQG